MAEIIERLRGEVRAKNHGCFLLLGSFMAGKALVVKKGQIRITLTPCKRTKRNTEFNFPVRDDEVTGKCFVEENNIHKAGGHPLNKSYKKLVQAKLPAQMREFKTALHEPPV